MAHTSCGWLFGELETLDIVATVEPFRVAADGVVAGVDASACLGT